MCAFVLATVVIIVLVGLLMGFRTSAGVLAWLAVAGILALFTGADADLTGNAKLGLLDVRDPTRTDQLLLALETPGSATSALVWATYSAMPARIRRCTTAPL